MSSNTENLENAIAIFMKDQTKENKAKMLNELQRSRLLLPGVFPEGTDIEKLKAEAKDQKIELSKSVKPMPLFIKNKEGEMFLPAYSSKGQMPKDQKPQVMMDVPFLALVTMALQEGLKLAGIAVNPYSGNILLREPFLKLIKEQEMKAKEGAKQIKLTPDQLRMIFRRKTEMEMIPKALFENPKEFTDTLCDKKEEYLKEFYQMVYKNPSECPYQESDFSVMPLNIREDLLLIRADLPAVKIPAPIALRLYILYNEEQNITDYYTVEMGKVKDTRVMGRVTSGLAHEDMGEAPVEGVEIQKVLDLYDMNHKAAN